jgi:hypothetical protein
MADSTARHCEVYLEIGAKRAFACAVDWPGWCRSGPDEPGALRALLEYGSRYAAVVRPARLGFSAPRRLEQIRVVERLAGNATTDFGAPGVIPSVDRAPVDEKDGARLEKVLRAGWQALDDARRRATGKELSRGPRGGGRELDAIIAHVIGADRGYLGGVGWKIRPSAGQGDPLQQTRRAILDALHASARGEIPAVGPRGGARWPARYFARRVAWHTIAHAWEIERRLKP